MSDAAVRHGHVGGRVGDLLLGAHLLQVENLHGFVAHGDGIDVVAAEVGDQISGQLQGGEDRRYRHGGIFREIERKFAAAPKRHEVAGIFAAGSGLGLVEEDSVFADVERVEFAAPACNRAGSGLPGHNKSVSAASRRRLCHRRNPLPKSAVRCSPPNVKYALVGRCVDRHVSLLYDSNSAWLD